MRASEWDRRHSKSGTNPAAMAFRFVTQSLRTNLRILPLPEGSTLIGSGGEADLVLDPAAATLFYGAVGRTHCRRSARLPPLR